MVNRSHLLSCPIYAVVHSPKSCDWSMCTGNFIIFIAVYNYGNLPSSQLKSTGDYINSLNMIVCTLLILVYFNLYDIKTVAMYYIEGINDVYFLSYLKLFTFVLIM